MSDPFPCELIGWSQCHRLCLRLAARIEASGYRPDLIVAIGRGGLIPGRILADRLGLMNLTSFKIEHYRGPRKAATARVRYPLATDVNGRRVLLLDDISDSGDTFTVALRHVRQHGTPRELRTAVLHHKLTSRYTPDFHARRIVKWRWIIYPWAVYEDLGHLLEAASPRSMTPAAAARWLAERHGLRISPRLLETLWPLRPLSPPPAG